MKDPNACRSMVDVRAGVDALDEQIVTLLGKRMRFMEAAARIKSDRESLRGCSTNWHQESDSWLERRLTSLIP